jgi:hypothetical protein
VILAALLAAAFVTAQSAALAHEIEHVLHLHDAPCALHLAADHLPMAPAPALPPTVTAPVSPRFECPAVFALPVPPAFPSAARAPPLLP